MAEPIYALEVPLELGLQWLDFLLQGRFLFQKRFDRLRLDRRAQVQGSKTRQLQTS